MSDEKLSPREILIREKLRAGLSRAQAEQVVDAQEAHDAALEEAAEKAAKKKSKDAQKSEDDKGNKSTETKTEK